MSLYIQALSAILSQISEKILSNFSSYDYGAQLSSLLKEIFYATELGERVKEIILPICDQHREALFELDNSFEGLLEKYDKDLLTETEVKGSFDQTEFTVKQMSPLQQFSFVASQGTTNSSIYKTKGLLS